MTITFETTAGRTSATRRIPASPAAIFAVVADPSGHVRIDGSGMLIATSSEPVRAVGDTFMIKMDRRPLGDVPNMAEYEVINTVTRFATNAEIEWNVARIGRPGPIFGHVYGYTLTPLSADETEVTSYCDWSAASEEDLAKVTFPVVPATALAASLDKLAEVVAGA